MADYVHGYGAWEAERLEDQARTLEELLHADTHYPEGAAVLVGKHGRVGRISGASCAVACVQKAGTGEFVPARGA